jgi:predicted DNA binding CopG/RHH family protein
MKKKTRYSDEDLGDLQVVADFLPPPEALTPKEDTVKVTIALSRDSVEFFKRQAKQNNTQYQKMIRRLLDIYARSFDDDPAQGAGRRAKR